MKITVIGDGAWGTALALLLVSNGHEVNQWGPFPEYLQEMDEKRENIRFLPGIKLDPRLRLSANPADAADANLWLIASPTQYMRKVLEQFKPYFRPEQHIILNVAKGIESESWMRIDEVVTSILGDCRFCTLSGPSHAEEVARGVPTAVTVASAAPGCAELVQQLMMNTHFRVYTSHDPIGVQLGGAIKNVMAIAAGVIDGMQLGDNPKAAMMTRAVAEMGRLGAALGGNSATFSGLAGIGDLIVTCCSQYSRNRHVGEELGKGKKLDQILQEMGMSVAEGVATSRGICALANQVAVEVPICRQIFAIIYEDLDPKIAVRNLMTRAARAEME
ncbi:MAG: NAD(P)-dependent glycerol-3-phosphate dehydrogenase [Lentisphaeria bacterium]|nr:NAD(P)-dependent glycerol-3-phosphate dehydrogenase [Lentisphaeria bacterium]